MYSVSGTWRTLVATDGHRFEMRLLIWLSADSYEIVSDAELWDVSLEMSVFSENMPSVGGCLAAELSATITSPAYTVPRMAKVRLDIRVTDGSVYSEWIPQGVFFIDTREYTKNSDGIDQMKFHAYDAMLKTEADYPATSHAWPMTDTQVVDEIARTIGVQVDSRTYRLMTRAYSIGLPTGYSMREVLGNIAAMYAGNFIMSYDGELRLITLTELPDETNYLIDSAYNPITFGGVIERAYSGSTVSFQEGDRVPLEEFAVSINPVQSGSGDPSPDNVRPIAGWTGVTISETGKNIIKLSAESEYAGLSQYATASYTANNDATFEATHTYSRKTHLFHVKVGETYRLSLKAVRSGGYGRILLDNTVDGNPNVAAYGQFQTTGTEVSYAKTFTATTDVLRIVFYVSSDGATGSLTVRNLQLEVGSVTTDFRPYNGAVIPISFGSAGTVYSGALDVPTGVLTVDRVKHVFTGSESVGLTQTGTNGYRYGFVLSDGRLPTTAQRTDFICNIMTPNANVVQQTVYQPGSALLYKNTTNNNCYMMCVVPLEYNTQAKAKQYLLDNGLEVVYPLATPQTYQISPQTIKTLIGDNVIWADAGNVNIEFTVGGEAVKILV